LRESGEGGKPERDHPLDIFVHPEKRLYQFLNFCQCQNVHRPSRCIGNGIGGPWCGLCTKSTSKGAAIGGSRNCASLGVDESSFPIIRQRPEALPFSGSQVATSGSQVTTFGGEVATSGSQAAKPGGHFLGSWPPSFQPKVPYRATACDLSPGQVATFVPVPAPVAMLSACRLRPKSKT
jgi:hypothetical protein